MMKSPFLVWFQTIPLLLLALTGCFPRDDNRFLEDQADLLSQSEKEQIVRYNEVLLQDLDIHFKLHITKDKLENINTSAVEIFGTLGKETRAAKGLLFLIDPLGEQLRIEVGYDLEEVFPDIFIGYIEERQMKPFFKAGKVGAGIEAAMELLVARMTRAIEGNQFDPERELPDMTYFSGGAGTRSDISIGRELSSKHKAPDRDLYQPGQSPEETLQIYMQVLRMHIKDPDLPLYTPATRTFFSNWVVTDAQQDNELRTLENAPKHEVKENGSHAVIRFPLKARKSPPYLFHRQENGWMLDFATMSRVLQMNHKNMWMMRNTDHPYMFLFEDWEFDRNGFPIREKR